MCCSTGRTPTAECATSPIRALHTLTPAQVSAVRSALPRLAGSWALDEQEGYDGELTLILTPEEQSGFSFALWRSPAGFHLVSMHGDEQVRCVVLPSIDEVLRDVCAALGRPARLHDARREHPAA